MKANLPTKTSPFTLQICFMSFISAWKSKNIDIHSMISILTRLEVHVWYFFWQSIYAIQATQYATLLKAFAPKLSQVSKLGTRLPPTKIDTTIRCDSETMSLLFIKSHIHQTLPWEKNKRKTLLQQCAFLLTIRNALKIEGFHAGKSYSSPME